MLAFASLAVSVLAMAAVAAAFGNGVNLQPSYYNGGVVSFGWDLMVHFPSIRTVRIEIEPDKAAQGAEWIRQAHSWGYEVIATYHKHSIIGTDSARELEAAGEWWRDNYWSLAASGPFTINLINEWGSHDISPHDYATRYNAAISIVRQVYDGPIIIDAPGYGQETKTLASAVLGVGGVPIHDKNLILSVHVYPVAWNSGNKHMLQQSDLDDLDKTGQRCMIGEFGNDPSGGCDWEGVVNYAKQKGWPVMGWAWNGDGGTMNMVTPAWKDDARAGGFTPSHYFYTIYNVL